MSDHYAILTMQKYHTFAQMRGLQAHNNREIRLPHIQYEDTIKNVTLVDAGESYNNAWHQRMTQVEMQTGHKVKVRKNGVKFIELLLTFSPDSDVPIKQWADANVKWLEQKFGKDNIIACTLHMDEETPHIHADVIPIDDRNKLCAKSFINGPADMRKLQSDYAKAMEPFGLHRGEKNTKSKKNTLKKFYSSLNQIENTPPPQIQEGESKDDYIIRLQQYIKDMQFAQEYLKKQAKRTDEIIKTRVANSYKQFADAILLQRDILLNMDDEEEMKKRLQLYRDLEQRVPRQELDKVLGFLKERYPEVENALFIRSPEGKAKDYNEEQ